MYLDETNMLHNIQSHYPCLFRNPPIFQQKNTLDNWQLATDDCTFLTNIFPVSFNCVKNLSCALRQLNVTEGIKILPPKSTLFNIFLEIVL